MCIRTIWDVVEMQVLVEYLWLRFCHEAAVMQGGAAGRLSGAAEPAATMAHSDGCPLHRAA